MERTNKPKDKTAIETTPVETSIWWRKKGGGSLRLNGKIIKPNEKFKAHPNDIPKGFKDLVVALEPLPGECVEPIEIITTTYTVKPRGKSKSLFDVVDGAGKVLNEKAIDKATAEGLVKDLAE